MNAALIYRPSRRSLFWLAFSCAVGIHVGAVVFAKGKSDKTVLQEFMPPGNEVEISYAQPDQPPPEPSATLPEQISPGEETFAEGNAKPARVLPRKKIRAGSVFTGTKAAAGSLKTLVTYAPRPVYPYEARRQRMIGAGIALLIVEPKGGNVTNARMAQSCGNFVLDRAALDAFRRWRFKPGIALSIEVPITYTLVGAAY
jgi:protein TonB